MEFRPFVNLDDTGSVTARVLAQSSAYVSLDPEARTVLAGRIAAGMTLGQDVSDLPADLRFFSGGGGSVRGYAYQGLSPRDALGRILGGASVAEAALEVRHWVYEDIGVALFADAGAAFSSDFPDFQDMGTGLGLGIRYRTPVGPLRLDVAIPLDPQASDPDFSLYVGLGQAF
jgi:translocation and assembly module TamA